MAPGDNKPALVALRERREQVIDSLSEHFASDALTVDEVEERIELAHRATTLAELDQLLADLEPPEVSQALVVRDQPEPPTVARPKEKKMRSVLASLNRTGQWVVPETLRVSAVLGEAKLDFREVQLPPGSTEIHVRTVLGSVEIIVPPTLAVECESSAFLGEIEERHRAPEASDPDAPRLVISGRVILGELTIETRLEGESRKDAKKRRKRQRKELAAAKRKRLTDGS